MFSHPPQREGEILICIPHLIIEHFNRTKSFWVISDKSEITYYPFNKRVYCNNQKYTLLLFPLAFGLTGLNTGSVSEEERDDKAVSEWQIRTSHIA